MTYSSGRTTEQFFTKGVLEGRTLYVSPRTFAAMSEAAVTAQNPNEGAYKAIRCALLDPQIEKIPPYAEITVIVDYDLRN